MKKLYCLMVLALILALVLTGCFIPLPIEFAVRPVIASVYPSSFTGQCPKTFYFSAIISVNGPGTVTYRWERSDGTYDPTPKSITFAEAGMKGISTSWMLGISYSGWERVHILTPNDNFSNKANFTLTCTQ